MFRCFFLAILLVIPCTSVFASSENSIAEKLSAQLIDTKTLSASFVQTIRDAKANVLQESIGSLLVKRPNKLHWLTTQPYEHLVVTDGETLWLYDIDLEQVNKERYDTNIDKAPALLLSGNVDAIVNNYALELKKGVDQLVFVLTPSNVGSAFSRLEIEFVDKTINSMTLQDNFDQTTTIEFSNTIINQTISDQQFNFVAPEGVEVISNDS